MRSRLLVLSVALLSLITGCKPGGTKEDPKPTEPNANHPWVAPGSPQAMPKEGTLNPRDDGGVWYMGAGDDCHYVTETVHRAYIKDAIERAENKACTVFRDDPAWKSCRFGEIRIGRDGKTCYCDQGIDVGRVVDCPKVGNSQ